MGKVDHPNTFLLEQSFMVKKYRLGRVGGLGGLRLGLGLDNTRTRATYYYYFDVKFLFSPHILCCVVILSNQLLLLDQ